MGSVIDLVNDESESTLEDFIPAEGLTVEETFEQRNLKEEMKNTRRKRYMSQLFKKTFEKHLKN